MESLSTAASLHRKPATTRTFLTVTVPGARQNTSKYYGFSNKNQTWYRLFYINGLTARMHELSGGNVAALVAKQ